MHKIAFVSILSSGDPRSLGRTGEAVAIVLKNPERLLELFDLMFHNDEIIRMRASDAVEKVCREHPDWLKPYTNLLLNKVSTINQPSVQWHLVQMLGEIELSKKEKQQALKVIRQHLNNKTVDWIVLNYSLETLNHLVKYDKSLKPELLKYLKKYQTSHYKSVASRVRRLLNSFDGSGGGIP